MGAGAATGMDPAAAMTKALGELGKEGVDKLLKALEAKTGAESEDWCVGCLGWLLWDVLVHIVESHDIVHNNVPWKVPYAWRSLGRTASSPAACTSSTAGA